MLFNLPKTCLVDKTIPKSKFFTKNLINYKLKEKFTLQISKIIWKYKLSCNTLNISFTDKIKEIQIFEIKLKQKIIPKNILKIINKSIPYTILYHFKFDDNEFFGIKLEDNKNQIYYFSNWNEKIDFDFNWLNLEIIYQNIIKSFIKNINTKNNNFEEIIEKDRKINILKKEIQKLKSNIKKEKQFNKKVELNKKLQEKEKLLEFLNN